MYQMLISQTSFTIETTVGSVKLHSNMTMTLGESPEKTKSIYLRWLAPKGHHYNLSLAKPTDCKRQRRAITTGKMNLGPQTVY